MTLGFKGQPDIRTWVLVRMSFFTWFKLQIFFLNILVRHDKNLQTLLTDLTLLDTELPIIDPTALKLSN